MRLLKIGTTAGKFSHGMHAGVMCLDLHPVHAQILAVGLYDGSVLVLSIHKPASQPLYSTAGQPGKHADAGGAHPTCLAFGTLHGSMGAFRG